METTTAIQRSERDHDYRSLNAAINFYDADGKLQLDKDKEATRQYFLNHVNKNTVYFHNLEEKLKYLVDEEYYEQEFLDQYDFEFIKETYKQAYAHKHRFDTFMGAYKYYTGYTLKTFDGTRYLERFEDRVVANALYLAEGNKQLATLLVDEIMSGRYQPATPTFLNSGKKQRGEGVSCFLTRIEDNLESISRSITTALQLSKRGGGVALLLSNIRETGSPIKKIENQSSGVIPVMKLLEDAFSYANQMGARNGSGAVYISVFHPDAQLVLDSRRENADEKIRIKTLSIGMVVPDIAFELAKNDEWLYQFSPYDVERIYGIPFGDMDITKHYRDMVNNTDIRKRKVKARQLFQEIAEVQIQSGYPYIMFEDTVNEANPIAGKINMSNLCSEILQVNTPSKFNSASDYEEIGKDISCNLGSLNIARVMDNKDLGQTVETAVRALTAVSDMSDISAAPSIQRGNNESHAIGLGQMNLHGYLAANKIMYGEREGLDFTNMYFYTVAYHAYKASNAIAKERNQKFVGFEDSQYADGSYFNKYIERVWEPRTERVKELFEGIHIPTQEDWKALSEEVQKHGLYNAYLQAVPPTGSISYINYATSSIHPIVDIVEKRREGKTGVIYYPAYGLSEETKDYYRSAYDIGYKPIIDTYAVATKHIDQGLSLTLFFNEGVTTRDLNRAQKYAHRKGIKTIYYNRIRQSAIEGTDVEGCVSCAL